LGQKLVELDARPSDSIALALQDQAEILVARHVYDAVEDMSWLLEEQDPDEEGEAD
jgi:bifunctional DNase/RNase